MNSLKESSTKRGRQSGREVKEWREGRQDEGLSRRRGKKQRERTTKKKEPILDGDCILRFSSFAENGFFGSLSVLRGNSLQM